MTNAELIKALRYCAEHEGCDYYIAKDCPREDTWVCGVDCEQILMCDAANALEAAEQRIDGLQKLVDINTERCEALRKQLREAHESYEKHINELEAQAAFFDAEKQNYQENIEYRDERIKELEAQMPKRGEWIMCESEKPYIVCKCSVCGGLTSEGGHYCPNCGARMDGENDADN